MNKKTSKMKKLYDVEYVETLKRELDGLFRVRYEIDEGYDDLTGDEYRDLEDPNPSELVKTRVKKIHKQVDDRYERNIQQRWDEEGIKRYVKMREDEDEEIRGRKVPWTWDFEKNEYVRENEIKGDK